MHGRREFIKGCAYTGIGAAAAASTGANADEASRAAEPHFFVFFQMRGAWDPTLAFEPKNRDDLMPDNQRATDQPYAYDEVVQRNGINFAPQGVSLMNYADRLAVVNGIDMEADNGHRMDAMMSGSLTARASRIPYFQAKLAGKHPHLKRTTLPHVYGAYDNDFFGASLAKVSTSATAGEVAGIVNASLSANAASSEISNLMISNYRMQVPQRLLRRKLLEYTEQVSRGQSLLSRFDAPIDLPSDVTTPEATGEIFGRLFANNVVGAATLPLGSLYFFDTHANHYDQHPLEDALDHVHRFCQALDSVEFDANTSVFERTTVFLTSEYTRTPRLNGFMGKDHNFRSNSLVMIGHKVRAGVYGRSGPARLNSGSWWGHSALPIDYADGMPKEDGQIMAAANLWAGLSPIVDVDCRPLFPGVTPISFLG